MRLIRSSLLILASHLVFCLLVSNIVNAQLNTTVTYVSGRPGPIWNEKAIAIGADGYARFVVEDSSTGGPDDALTYVHCLDQNCSTFNTSTFPIASLSPTIALGPDGYAQIAFAASPPDPDPFAGEDVFHSFDAGLIQCNDDNCSSSTTTWIAPSSDNGVASITVGSDGTAYILYDYGNDFDGPQGVGLATCSPSPLGLCSTTQIAEISISDCIGGTITLDPNGNPVIIYIDDSYDTNASVHYYTQGADAVISNDVGGYEQVDVAIGPDGFARIVFPNFATNGRGGTPGVNFVQCLNSACGSLNVNTISLSGAQNNYGSLAVEANGNVDVEIDLGSYYDLTYYVQCTAVDCSAYNSQNIAAVSGESAGLASLVLGTDGHPLMIAQDATGIVYEVRPLVPKYLYATGMSAANNECENPEPYPGVAGSVHYQVLDQDGNQLMIAGMTPEEQLTVNGVVVLTYSTFSTPVTSGTDGLFDDVPVGACFPSVPPPNMEYCGNPITQNFEVVYNNSTYSIATVSTQLECYDGVQVSGTGNPSSKNFTYTLGNP
ncbi:MAG: hypothetical protein WCA20_00400 [Candidatus Sulfotelmatobacter sp.]